MKSIFVIPLCNMVIVFLLSANLETCQAQNRVSKPLVNTIKITLKNNSFWPHKYTIAVQEPLRKRVEVYAYWTFSYGAFDLTLPIDASIYFIDTAQKNTLMGGGRPDVPGRFFRTIALSDAGRTVNLRE